MAAAIELFDVSRVHGDRVKTRALGPVSLAFEAGEVAVVLGPSGSGKTTLLNLLGALDRPSTGRILSSGADLAKLDDKGLADYRRRSVGFVFQFFNLVETLTVRENVLLAKDLAGGGDDVSGVLDSVGLGEMRDRFPSELSGGQQQRVAVARALVKRPGLLLCDEPTGALDTETGKSVLELLVGAARDTAGCAVVIVTHNAAVSAVANRTIRLRDGLVVADERTGSPLPVPGLTW